METKLKIQSYGTQFNAPEGYLLNGKIVPSVASNNLTVALKGLDGNDPSATNPVSCWPTASVSNWTTSGTKSMAGFKAIIRN